MKGDFNFGYNEPKDDYKVIARSLYCSGGDFVTKVKVYSVRTDSWRRVEDYKGCIHYYNGTYANGKIWWTTKRMSKWKMASLDMGSDKYEEVQGPVHVHVAGAYDWEVTVLGGRLVVLCNYYNKKVDLWAMDKFGVEESWSQVVSVTYVHPAKPLRMIQVLCISRNGEIVFVDILGSLVVYSSKGKEFRNIQLGGLRSFTDVFVYAESLVSPYGL